MSYDPPESDPDWCYSHSCPEPGPHFKVCGECGHGFPTPEALQGDDANEFNSYAPPPWRPVGEIWSCPHCCHDF